MGSVIQSRLRKRELGGEEKNRYTLIVRGTHLWFRSVLRAERQCLLEEALLEAISQQPPVLPNLHETVDFVAHLHVFGLQTLLQKRRARTGEAVGTHGTKGTLDDG